MTPQEQEMIDGLISRIRSTQVQNKDTAAEQRLQQGLAGFPDSTYVLAQTVLVQGYGLQQAQSQLEDLKQQNATLQDQLQQVQQAHEQAKSSGGSFLSHIFGSGSSQSAPPPPPASGGYQTGNSGNYPPAGYPSGNYPGGGYPPSPANTSPAGYPAPSGNGMFGGGGGGFLQGAMRTAAGVAAGEIAFRGIEDLFHGFGGGGGERGFTGMGGGGGETVVNNYYDDGGGNDRGDNRNDNRDTGNFYNPSDDASRSDTGDGSQFANAGNDGGGFSDSGDNNSGFDDSSSFDDSGSDDSNL